jgi:hypothetical protein
MADHDRARRLERIQQTHDIADQMEHGVLIDRFWPVALAVTAHVRGDRMEACRGECFDLVTPRVPAFRKAVAQQNKRVLALLDDIQADTVGLDDSLDRFAHGPRPTRPSPLARALPRNIRAKEGVAARVAEYVVQRALAIAPSVLCVLETTLHITLSPVPAQACRVASEESLPERHSRGTNLR